MNLNEEQRQAILEERLNITQSRRVNSPALDDMLYTPIPVLNEGFIRVVDYMGNDAAVAQAARVSYGNGTKSINSDEGLIRYLLRHRHSTPFEMCEIKLHLKMPIFVARQWLRHRTANANEYSGRYSIMSDDYYVPEPENIAEQSTTNKQGREGGVSAEHAEDIIGYITATSEKAYRAYKTLLNRDSNGTKTLNDFPCISRELSRMVLPVNFYTELYWKIDLHNLLHFVSLRADSHAQYEIRVYAQAILDIVKQWCPITYQAFMDYRANAASLSAQALDVTRAIIRGESPTQESSGLSKREWGELMELLEK